MKKKKHIITAFFSVGLILVGTPAAVLAIDLDFLSGLTDDISRLTHIDENVLNSGIKNLSAVQSLWDGDVSGGVAGLADANLGRLGVEDSTVGRIRSDAEHVLDRGAGSTLADGQYRSKLIQQHVHRILSGKGQEQAGQLLARSAGFNEVSKNTLKTQEQLSKDAIAEAQKTNRASNSISAKGRRAQGSRSSQDVLKSIASQNVDLGKQNSALSEQYSGINASLAGLATQLSAQASQTDLLNRQLASDQVAQAYQVQGLAEINQQLAALNYNDATERQRDSAAVGQASQGVIIPQLNNVVRGE